MKKPSQPTGMSLRISLIFGATIVFTAGSAIATLTPERTDRGEQIIQIPVPGRASEICVIPHHFADAKYSEKDLKKEQELCSMDYRENVAVCPKLNSTNPGLLFHKIPEGYTRQQVQDKGCEIAGPIDPETKKPKNLAKKLAKYKLSSSCSYTPSILGYYHLSRILGKVANVPQAVLRTFDLETHKDLADVARDAMNKKKISTDDIIRQTWGGLESAMDAGEEAKRKDALFTDRIDQTYGALSENPTGEAFYSDFFNKAAGGQTRAEAFRDKNPIYAKLTRQEPVSKMIGTEFTKANVESFVQLKDASEMILMDTVLSQQDRFGNIHFEETWYYRDLSDLDKQGNPKIKTKGKLTPEEVSQLGAVRVREMMLKDNDCGVSKDNLAKKAGLLDRVAHMDPKVYKRFMKFAETIEQENVESMFKIGMMFTSGDYETFEANVREAVTKLKNACRAGKLRLDLDLENHFAGKAPEAAKCD